MIKIGESEVRNLADEMTLKEWEQVRGLIGDASDSSKSGAHIDAWFKIFKLMGASKKDLNMRPSVLLEKIFEFNKPDGFNKEFTRTLKVEGFEYTAYEAGEKFFIDSRMLDAMEQISKKDGNVTFAQVVAACFKRDDLTDNEHFEIAHIKHKAKAFESVSASIAVPYLAEFNIEIAETLKVKEKYEPSENVG